MHKKPYKTILLCQNKSINCLNFLYELINLYYILLDLKKVVISIYFNLIIYIELELLNYQFLYLVNYYFLIKILYFLDKFTYLLLVYTRKLLFSSLIFNYIHCCWFGQLEHKSTLTLSKGIAIYKTLIFVLDFRHCSHILQKYKMLYLQIYNICKYFVLLTSVIVIIKNGVSS